MGRNLSGIPLSRSLLEAAPPFVLGVALLAAPEVLNRGEELEHVEQVEVNVGFLSTSTTFTTEAGVLTVGGMLNARPGARATLYLSRYRRAFVYVRGALRQAEGRGARGPAAESCTPSRARGEEGGRECGGSVLAPQGVRSVPRPASPVFA